jgi:hypothetical protein
MAASQPPLRPSAPRRPRRRARRGSLARPLNGQLYRSAFLVLSFPLLLAALTISRPPALQAPQLPPAFDGRTAIALTRELVTDYPTRVPGSSGGLGAAQWLREKLALYDLSSRTDAWAESVPGLGRVRLQNLIAVVPGQSPDAIVVMAHRDNTGDGPGANDNASGTAALVELARGYGQPPEALEPAARPSHTLIFLSTDAGSFGGLGTVRFAERSALASRVVAVVNLDSLAGAGAPRLELAGDRPRSPAPRLVQTAARRILEQTGARPGHASFLGQLVDLGFPLTFYEQGPFVARGIPAVTLTTSPTRPPSAFGDSLGRLNAGGYERIGTAAQGLLGSLDQGLELAQGTTSAVWLGDRVLQGWALQLVLIALVLPFLVATVDLFAFCRRNRIRLGPAARALRSRLGFWLFVGAVFTCFRLLGAWPGGPARPPNPETAAVDDLPVLALAAFLALVGGGWLVGRQRLVPRRRVTAEELVAGQTVALLALAIVALLVIGTNPFALLFLLVPLHVWVWLPQVRTARLPVRLALFTAGLAGPALLLASLAWRFGLGADAPWYLLVLVGVGYVETVPVLIALAGAAVAAQLAATAAGRYAPYPDARERPPRGPIRELVRSVAVGLRGRRRAAGLRRVAEG